MSDKFFPLNTATACKLKWAWSTIVLRTGTTKSCHRVEGDKIDLADFGNFHNTERKVQHRELMLQGKWPEGNCSYCKIIEDAGGQSDRITHNNIPGCVPEELRNDLSATVVVPKILEIYFDNICNMGCIYCNKGFSSVLEHEYNKFGEYSVNANESTKLIAKSSEPDSLDTINLRKEKLFQWLNKNHNSLERLHFLGGEPFFQPEFERMFDFFEKNPCPGLEYNIVTNLKISHKKLQQYVEKLHTLVECGHLKRVDITCSIDCFGYEQEYVRYGLDIDQWKQNFLYLVDQSWIYLSINQTLNSLTIKTIPELIKFINNHKTPEREINHFFGLVVGGDDKHVECQHPKYFGPGYFNNDFDNILQCMNEDTWQEQQAKNYMLGIKKGLQHSTRDDQQISRLIDFLDEIDSRRNLNWRSVFPWLTKELDSV